jgi:hypothetical protein
VSDDERYHERLWPTWWACALALVPALMLSVAYAAALGPAIGLVVTIASVGLTVLVLVVTAPRLAVSPSGLAVGAALLPPTAIGGVEAVDAGRIRELRGPGADARTFVALRPWSASGGVLVTVDDPQDPHPAWLLTSRHPARMVSAITATMSR